MKYHPKILIVEDEANWAENFMEIGADFDAVCCIATNIDAAMEKIKGQYFDIALVDLKLEASDSKNRQGIDLIKWIKDQKKEIDTVISSGTATLDDSREAFVHYGIKDIIQKKSGIDEMKTVLQRVILNRKPPLDPIYDISGNEREVFLWEARSIFDDTMKLDQVEKMITSLLKDIAPLKAIGSSNKIAEVNTEKTCLSIHAESLSYATEVLALIFRGNEKVEANKLVDMMGIGIDNPISAPQPIPKKLLGGDREDLEYIYAVYRSN